MNAKSFRKGVQSGARRRPPARPSRVTIWLAGLLIAQSGGVVHLSARAAGQHDGHTMPVSAPPTAENPGHRGPIAGASTTPTAVFDRDGRLWVAWVDGTAVYVSSSSDQGRSFAPGVRVADEPDGIDATSESRPKIVVEPDGQIDVSYTSLGRELYTGDVRFSRSVDGGRTFSPPVTVNDDGLPVGHRFDALSVAPDGRIYLTWIDKRDVERAARDGREYAGGALYYTFSTDGGLTFAPNRKLDDNICECCQLATAFDASNRLALFFRDILPGSIRDHAFVMIDDGAPASPVRRVTEDGWAIDACPHHGPSLAIDADGTYHLTWFTGAGPQGGGSFYARSTDRGRTFSAPRRVGVETPQQHAVVLSQGRQVFLAWMQPDRPAGTALYVQQSDDAGLSWSVPRAVAQGTGVADHPYLLSSKGTVFVSWFTSADGYRLVPLTGTR